MKLKIMDWKLWLCAFAIVAVVTGLVLLQLRADNATPKSYLLDEFAKKEIERINQQIQMLINTKMSLLNYEARRLGLTPEQLRNYQYEDGKYAFVPKSQPEKR